MTRHPYLLLAAVTVVTAAAGMGVFLAVAASLYQRDHQRLRPYDFGLVAE